MSTTTYDPTATVTSGDWVRTGGTTKHGVLADSSDATYLSISESIGTGTTLTMGPGTGYYPRVDLLVRSIANFDIPSIAQIYVGGVNLGQTTSGNLIATETFTAYGVWLTGTDLLLTVGSDTTTTNVYKIQLVTYSKSGGYPGAIPVGF